MALYSQYCMRITSFPKGTIPFEGAPEEAFESGKLRHAGLVAKVREVTSRTEHFGRVFSVETFGQ